MLLRPPPSASSIQPSSRSRSTSRHGRVSSQTRNPTISFNPIIMTCKNQIPIRARHRFRRRVAEEEEEHELVSDSPLSVDLEPIISEQQFNLIMEASQHQLLIILWMATWCRKCIYLKPKLEKLAADYHPRIHFYCIDVNAVPHKLVARAGVTSMDLFANAYTLCCKASILSTFPFANIYMKKLTLGGVIFSQIDSAGKPCIALSVFCALGVSIIFYASLTDKGFVRIPPFELVICCINRGSCECTDEILKLW